MKKSNAQSITSVGQSPEAERHTRWVKYTTAMSIRMVCFILFFFVHGWWLAVVGIAAVVLPYIGVVVANNVIRRPQDELEAPGAIVVYHSDGEPR